MNPTYIINNNNRVGASPACIGLIEEKEGFRFDKKTLKALECKNTVTGFFVDNGIRKPFHLRITKGTHKTYTIRVKMVSGSTNTELEKMKRNIENNGVHPEMWVHFNVDDFDSPGIISYAYMLTKDLLDFRDKHPNKVREATSDNDFIYMYWADIKDTGYDITIVKNYVLNQMQLAF